MRRMSPPKPGSDPFLVHIWQHTGDADTRGCRWCKRYGPCPSWTDDMSASIVVKARVERIRMNTLDGMSDRVAIAPPESLLV